MRVTQVTTIKTGKSITFFADFIFTYPYGGKKDRLITWGKWLANSLANPLQVFKFGFTVRRRVWFVVPTQYASQANINDAFFLLALPLAIATNEDLIFEGAVAEELIAKSTEVQAYYQEISRRKILIKARTIKEQASSTKSVAQFFTLGVDSFYTLCCHSEKRDVGLRQLIYVDGYDVPFYQKRFLNLLHQKIARVAKQTKTTSVVVSSNLREVSDEIIGWGRFHVSALAAVSKLLDVKKTYISGESFESPDWGLRFGVDKLYSTKNRQVQLVAHNVPREQKIQRILKSSFSQTFLRFVRVCWENARIAHLPYNCSTCQKCLKTQLSLMALGVKKTPTFKKLDLQALKKIQLVEHVYKEWQELYEALKKNKETDPLVLTAVESVLKKPLRV